MGKKRKTMAVRNKIKNVRHFSSMLLISLLLLAISCSIWIAKAKVNRQIQEYEQARVVLENQIEDEKKQQEVIQDKIDYLKSDEYIEDIARDKLGLIFENEIIFKKQKK